MLADRPERRLSKATIDPTRPLQSLYVAMGDGVRLAVDVWLPLAELRAGRKVGTILRATRYHRARAQSQGSAESDTNAAEAELFRRAGLALIVADARGTGASFGCRTTELSEREIADYGELIDWIAGEGPSNGRVGAYGYSYDGDTAELMARLDNPHLVAVAPLFSDFDPYRQLVYPGGCYTEGAFGRWLGVTQVLDGVVGAAEQLAQRTGVTMETLAERFPPVKPVDGPDGGALLAQAVAEHQGNVDLSEPAARADCRDDREHGINWDALSPAHYQQEIEASGLPLFVRAGWLDAGTAAGTLSRFATFTNPQEVEIAAWSHGGETPADPLRDPEAAEDRWLSLDAQNERLVEFFTRYVGRGQRPSEKRTLTLSGLGGQGRRTLTSWPPTGLRSKRWWLAADAALAEVPGAGTSSFTVDGTASSGTGNRWIGNVTGQPVAYPDRALTDAALLTWTSRPLRSDQQVLGYPILTVRLSASAGDAAVYAYLEAVSPDDRVTYLTEGQLRLCHRAAAGAPVPTARGVRRSFSRPDRVMVAPGDWMDVTIELLPILALIPADHRLRVAVAGHDASCFTQYASDGDTLTIQLGDGSHLDLPVQAPE